MRRLRSILFSIIFTIGTGMAIVIGLGVGLLGRRILHRYVYYWSCFHQLCCRLLLGIRTRIEGEIPSGPVLIASKHEAMYETLEMVRIITLPAIVVKRELVDFPAWAWVTRLFGLVPVDREASARALKTMMRAADTIADQGRPLVIFPEGTRVPHGEAPPLKAGFAGLYNRMRRPVVPVALDSGRVWPRYGLQRPGIITIRFGEPIPPGLPRAEMEARVHAAINALNG